MLVVTQIIHGHALRKSRTILQEWLLFQLVVISIDGYEYEKGEWVTFINAYGRRAALSHQQNYVTFAKALQAIIEDADSGALKEKIRCKRMAAKQGHVPRARGAGGRVGR